MRNNILRTQRIIEPFQEIKSEEIKIEEIKNELQNFLNLKFEKKKDEFTVEIADTVKQEFDKEKENIVAEITETIKYELDGEKEIKKNENPELDTEEQLKKDIISEYIYPDNKETIKSLLKNRKFYSKLLQYVRVLKIIFSAIIVPGLLLSDTQFPGKYLSYIAGISSFFVACLELGDRMIVESNKKRVEKINNILDSIGISYKVTDSTLDDPLRYNEKSLTMSKRQLNLNSQNIKNNILST